MEILEQCFLIWTGISIGVGAIGLVIGAAVEFIRLRETGKIRRKK